MGSTAHSPTSKSPFTEDRLASIVGKKTLRRENSRGSASSLAALGMSDASASTSPYGSAAPSRRASVGDLSSSLGGVDSGRLSPLSVDGRVSPTGADSDADVTMNDIVDDRRRTSLGRASGASSVMSFASTVSAGGGGSRAKPANDSNLPGAPGRFLSWLPREPTLEGTLEKQKSEGYFGSISRMFGMTKRGWKMRHFVLYDNHLFWGRGFSRMYGYGTVLSAKAELEQGETAFSLELVTHPKFSLRRGGYESLDYMQRLYGLCCSTHGYSVRVMRAGTVLDRDRWISSLQRGLPPGATPDGSTRPDRIGASTPTSPIDAIDSQEQSVFGQQMASPTMTPRSSPGSIVVEGHPASRPTSPGILSQQTQYGSSDNIAEKVDASGGFSPRVGIKKSPRSKAPATLEEAREQSGLWTPRDTSGAEAEAAAAWEAAAHAAIIAEAAAAEEEAAREAEEDKKATLGASVAKKAELDGDGSGSRSFNEVLDSVLEDEARDQISKAPSPNGGRVTVSGGKPPRHGFPPKKHDSAQSMARSSSSSGSDEDVKDSARGSPEMSPDEEPDSPEPDYDTADEAPSDDSEGARTSVDDDGTGARRGDSVPAEWLAANTGGVRKNRLKSQAPVSVLRKTSSIEQKSRLSKGGSLRFTDAVALLGGGSVLTTIEADGPGSLRRKVSFREESEIESTKLYAPTPTKRNPQGVGQTSAKDAPFAAKGDGAPGTIDELDVDDPTFDASLAGQLGSFSQQRALQQAAGRWVIPPQELKLGRRIGAGSFGVVYTADWNGTEVALKQMHDKSLSSSNVQEFSGEIRMMQGMRHPNIVLFLGAVIQAPRLSIVCELMPLGSLHALLHGKTQNGVELATNGRLRRQMAQDCARGMSYLHSRSPPVVHHDLKPANLLVDSHWTLKVSDFGMSRLKHNTYLSSKSPGGTPEWMAPEVLRNDPTDERSDVYSFAVVLWELITLKYPWEELSSPVQIVVQVAFLHRRPKLPTWLPAEAVALLQQCWHKDPDERPAFSDVLAALKSEMPEAWMDRPTESPKAAAFAALARKEQPFSGPVSPQRPGRRVGANNEGGPGSVNSVGSVGGSVGSVNSLTSSVTGGSVRSASPSIEGNFVTLTGLKPIKTPKPAKKKNTSALGPNHISADANAGEEEDDDEVFKGFPGMGRVKVPGTARSVGSDCHHVSDDGMVTPPRSPPRSAPGSSSNGVKSPEMAAAAGVLPKLSPLKIVRKLPTK